MHICAVPVLDTEYGPHSSPADLGKCDEKAEDGGVLDIMGVNGVKNPVEAEDWV